jgi:hypothetical protein
VDRYTGQMVTRMIHRDTTNSTTHYPQAAWRVRLTGPGISGEAVTDHQGGSPLFKYLQVEYPKDFRNAPSGPVRPGRYEARWTQHPYTYDRETGDFKFGNGSDFGSHSWTVYDDGRTWL